MKTVFYKADSRGRANHGWLDAHHTFSFAGYNNPERVHFGALRVLNDDIVLGGQGFGTHPHDNMEIITIPIYGQLEHKDSMGHIEVIKPGEVQVMSAGTGIMHSEYNADKTKPVNLFQIWIFPNEKNVTPRYDQKYFDFSVRNQLTEIVSPDQNSESLWVHQNTWLNVATLNENSTIEYKTKQDGNGVFAMVMDGSFEIENQKLNLRDGLSIADADSISIKATSEGARVLLIEVPMKF